METSPYPFHQNYYKFYVTFIMKTLQLLLLFAPLVSFGQETFLEKHDNTVWTDGSSTISFRKLSSIKYSELTKQIKGYVFDGFLKKSYGDINLYNDQGYFIISDSIQNLNNLYVINAKSGLNVRKAPSSSGEIITTLGYGIAVIIKSGQQYNNVDSFIINDIDKDTGESIEVEGKWVEIETYSPTGHRQELFPDNNGSWSFTNKVDEMTRYLECHMCGYKAITENSSDALSFIQEEKGDYGPTTYVSNSFSIDNSKMIEVRNHGNDTNEGSSETIWVSTRSDSDYIEKIKVKNKKVLKVNTQTELDSIAEMNYEKNQIMMEENDFEELGNYFRYNANIKENPKNAVDYNHNGMVKFFKLNDKSSAIIDFNKSIELNPGSANQFFCYFIRGLIKNDLNIKGACDDWIKAADLGYYTAKKMFRENCK